MAPESERDLSAIDQLERAGLIAGAVRERGTRRTTRVVYSATRAGDEALDAWLRTTDAPPEPIRSELLLRIAFARPEDREALLAQLAVQERACRELLGHCEPGAVPGVHALVTSLALARLRAELGWLREAREAIAAGALEE